MVTSIVGCAPEAVQVGMTVEVTFDDVAPQVTLPRFKPRLARRDGGSFSGEA
jgi:hypothetical protein